MQMVILVGGLATRLGTLTQDIPKSMICIKGKPFLEYQIDLLKRSHITDIILCVGHKGEQIQTHFGDGSRFGIHIQYSVEQDKLLGTAGALKNASHLLEEEFLLMYGDSYLLLDYPKIMTSFYDSGKLGLMVAYKNSNCHDCSNVILENNLIKVYDKKQQTPDMIYIDEGLSALKKSALNFISEDEAMSLEYLYNRLIEQRELLAFETDQRFYEIGSPAGIEEFSNLVESGDIPT